MKLNYIEISRGIAALLVVLHHATLDLNDVYGLSPAFNFFYFGMSGVDFFFVLSGFIIYFIHSQDTSDFKSIKKYALKRLIRIYPTFLMVCIPLLIAFKLLPTWNNRIDFNDTFFIVKSLLLLPNEETPILSVSWTLVHEMFFYGIFLIFIWKHRLGILIFLLWAIAILYFNLFKPQLNYPIDFYLSKFNLLFIMGMIVSHLIKKINFNLPNKRVILSFGIIVFLLNGINVNYQIIQMNGLLSTTLYGLSSSFIIAGLACMSLSQTSTSLQKLALLLGSASYSIYLIHYPVQSVLQKIIKKLDLVEFVNIEIIFLSVVIISTVAGIVLHLVFEKPVLRYLRKRLIN